MESLDQIKLNKSYNDVAARRLKNRERQRRYRARKRLEAHPDPEPEQASVTKILTQLPVEKQPNGNLTSCVTRVHCKRNWKKDARLAHMMKAQAVTSHGPVISAPTLANDSKVTCLPFGVRAEPLLESQLHYKNPSSLENLETTSTTHGRRDWKAEARNKNKCS